MSDNDFKGAVIAGILTIIFLLYCISFIADDARDTTNAICEKVECER